MFLQFNWGKSFLLKCFRYFLIPILILINSGAALAQYDPGVNNNVQLLGTLSPAFIGGYGDIWGYVDPNTNKEYALLCARNEGLYIIEITDPSNPTVTSFVPSPPGSNDAKDVKTYLNFAYVVHQSGPLQIIDLSDPANPTDTTFTNPSLSNGFHNIFIDDAGFAYIAIQTGQAAGDRRIFDLTNPNQPVEMGVYFHPNVGQGFVESHDVYTRNDTSYVSYLEGGLVILDVTDRSNPQELAITNYPDNFTHSAWTTEDGRYVLTTDEVTNGHLMIWDIQDLGNISLVSEYESSPGIIIHNAYVSGDFVYISYYVDGLRIVDLSDITQPTEVGYYDTFLQQGTSFDGVWGVYPFFPSGNIVISDLETGLYVVQFDTVRAGGIEGTVTDLLTGLPIPDVNVDFIEANKSVQTDQNGFYSLRTNEGNHTIIFSKAGYFPDTLSVTLPSGPSITQDVTLDPNLADIEVSVDSLSMILPINTIATTDLI
ncbi:MAG: choice-of-anchor B family protein, partial [Bacteroidetes bacterium]|nr:choice-of-anchor B family protein [Bacteroidota bacterium]